MENEPAPESGADEAPDSGERVHKVFVEKSKAKHIPLIHGERIEFECIVWEGKTCDFTVTFNPAKVEELCGKELVVKSPETVTPTERTDSCVGNYECTTKCGGALVITMGNEFSWLTSKLVEITVVKINPEADRARAAQEAERQEAAQRLATGLRRPQHAEDYQRACHYLECEVAIQEAIHACPAEAAEVLRALRTAAVKLLPLAEVARRQKVELNAAGLGGDHL